MDNVKINESRILITGGTGSWGHEVTTQLLQKYPDIKEIRIYSRGEHRQVEMMQEFGNNPKLKFIVGDIRDKKVLQYAMKNIDIVFHLAALKHVPVCENNTWEAVMTNIVGTQNVIEAAIDNHVKKVVDISTDKAVDAFNLYGMTKAVGEKLILNANFNYEYNGSGKTRFVCIRGGNVIGTNGSVIPLFKKQILENNEITITNPNMTRFLMSTREAVSLIFTAVDHAIGGELFVMNMPAATVSTVANAMIRLFGTAETKVRIVGDRPGEKMHEALVSKNESVLTHKLSDKYFVIIPQIENEELKEKYKSYPLMERFAEFNSENTTRLTTDELENILRNEPLLWGSKTK